VCLTPHRRLHGAWLLSADQPHRVADRYESNDQSRPTTAQRFRRTMLPTTDQMIKGRISACTALLPVDHDSPNPFYVSSIALVLHHVRAVERARHTREVGNRVGATPSASQTGSQKCVLLSCREWKRARGQDGSRPRLRSTQSSCSITAPQKQMIDSPLLRSDLLLTLRNLCGLSPPARSNVWLALGRWSLHAP
jgi:hypothetical protein